MNILTVQKSAHSLNTADTHNLSSSRFHLMNLSDLQSCICFYINKSIDINFWSVKIREINYCSIKIMICSDTEIWQKIFIHNVYNSLSVSTTSTDSLFTLSHLKAALQQKDIHIIVRDFNLYHSYWRGQWCLTKYTAVNQLVNITTEVQLDLLLSSETVTQKINAQYSTIDLVFISDWITERLLSCRVRENLYHRSDYLSVITEISLCIRDAIQLKHRAWKKLNTVKLLKFLIKAIQSMHHNSNLLQIREIVKTYVKQM